MRRFRSTAGLIVAIFLVAGTPLVAVPTKNSIRLKQPQFLDDPEGEREQI